MKGYFRNRKGGEGMTRENSALKAKSGRWKWCGTRYGWEKFKRLFHRRGRQAYRHSVLTEEDMEGIKKNSRERFLREGQDGEAEE